MIDRVPRYPGRVLITPESGQSYYATIERSDQPTQEGTPLNTATLFDASTAKLYNLAGNNATPNKAFAQISSHIDLINQTVTNIENSVNEASIRDTIISEYMDSGKGTVTLDFSNTDFTKYSEIKIILSSHSMSYTDIKVFPYASWFNSNFDYRRGGFVDSNGQIKKTSVTGATAIPVCSDWGGSQTSLSLKIKFPIYNEFATSSDGKKYVTKGAYVELIGNSYSLVGTLSFNDGWDGTTVRIDFHDNSNLANITNLYLKAYGIKK